MTLITTLKRKLHRKLDFRKLLALVIVTTMVLLVANHARHIVLSSRSLLSRSLGVFESRDEQQLQDVRTPFLQSEGASEAGPRDEGSDQSPADSADQAGEGSPSGSNDQAALTGDLTTVVSLSTTTLGPLGRIFRLTDEEDYLLFEREYGDLYRPESDDHATSPLLVNHSSIPDGAEGLGKPDVADSDKSLTDGTGGSSGQGAVDKETKDDSMHVIDWNKTESFGGKLSFEALSGQDGPHVSKSLSAEEDSKRGSSLDFISSNVDKLPNSVQYSMSQVTGGDKVTKDESAKTAEQAPAANGVEGENNVNTKVIDSVPDTLNNQPHAETDSHSVLGVDIADLSNKPQREGVTDQNAADKPKDDLMSLIELLKKAGVIHNTQYDSSDSRRSSHQNELDKPGNVDVLGDHSQIKEATVQSAESDSNNNAVHDLSQNVGDRNTSFNFPLTGTTSNEISQLNKQTAEQVGSFINDADKHISEQKDTVVKNTDKQISEQKDTVVKDTDKQISEQKDTVVKDTDKQISEQKDTVVKDADKQISEQKDTVVKDTDKQTTQQEQSVIEDIRKQISERNGSTGVDTAEQIAKQEDSLIKDTVNQILAEKGAFGADTDKQIVKEKDTISVETDKQTAEQGHSDKGDTNNEDQDRGLDAKGVFDSKSKDNILSSQKVSRPQITESDILSNLAKKVNQEDPKSGGNVPNQQSSSLKQSFVSRKDEGADDGEKAGWYRDKLDETAHRDKLDETAHRDKPDETAHKDSGRSSGDSERVQDDKTTLNGAKSANVIDGLNHEKQNSTVHEIQENTRAPGERTAYGPWAVLREAYWRSPCSSQGPDPTGSQPLFPPCRPDIPPGVAHWGRYPYVGPFDYIRESKNPCFYDAGRTLRCVPYFFLAGFSKCGSSDLFVRIRKHPQVAASIKEVKWFSRRRFPQYYYDSAQSFGQYLQYFNTLSTSVEKDISQYGVSKKIVGDYSIQAVNEVFEWDQLSGNEGCSEPRVINANHIRHLNPAVKIIIIMRHPVQRLYSRFLYDYGRRTLNDYRQQTPVNASLRTPETFHRLVVSGLQRYYACFQTASLRHCIYNRTLWEGVHGLKIQDSMYAVLIEDWLRVIPRDQILFLRSEDFKNDIRGHMETVFKFLDLDVPNHQQMRDICSSAQFAVTGKNSPGPMLPETEKLLLSFFSPFMHRLAQLLDDSRFLWNDS